MKIFLDNIIYSLQNVGGISVYWDALTTHFEMNNISFTAVETKPNKSLFSKVYKQIIQDRNLPLIILRIFPILIKLPKKSLFHSSYLRVSLQKDVCNIVTIHDLAAEEKKITGFRRYLKLGLQYVAIRRADGIICVSNSTQQSLKKYYKFSENKRIKTIYHGCSKSFFPTNEKPKKIILFIGGRGVYKNFKICVSILANLPDYTLFLIGGEVISPKERIYLNTVLEGRYYHFLNVPTEKLNELYNQAHCLLYPSTYEGFGMPIIEAMSAGCPVITSNISAIKEVCDGSAILIDDFSNYKPFLDAVTSLENIEFRKRYIQKGLNRAKEFDWDKHFNEVFSFYKEVYNNKFRD